MRLITNLLLFFVGVMASAQTVTIDNTSNSPSELVDILLGNACVEVSNVTISSNQAVAYFNNQGGTFPISEGVVIRAGEANFSEGSYTGTNLSSQLNSNSDTYLSQIFNSTGQSPLITDVAFLEFEFVPLSKNFSFDFLFASNEYGEWQCLSSDVFAFLLTDLSTGTTTNLAVIPGTTTPISIRSIKDNAYNPACNSTNANLFSTYNVNNPSGSTINMRGYTVILHASSQITPGNPYKIRLVIGDSNDANYDSAIFLSAGSFNADFNLGPDRIICEGDVRTIDTGLDPSIYNHTWTMNGTTIPGENGNSITINGPGTYGVSITDNNTNCLLTDEIVYTDLMVNSPEDIVLCHQADNSYTYNLTLNNPNSLGINNNTFDIVYYASNADLTAGNPIPTGDISSYDSSGNQTIYFKILNTVSGYTCDAVYQFELLVNNSLNLSQPDPIKICTTPPSNLIVDLTQVNSQIANGQNLSGFNFSYFQSQSDAQNNSNPIATPTAFPVQTGSSAYTIWVRVEDAQMPECFQVIDFQIILQDPPPVSTLADVVACSSYTLPTIANGNYYTNPNGNGQALFAGDIIQNSQTIYIFNYPNDAACSNQSSFEVILMEEYTMEDTYCGEFIVPTLPAGAFYTAAGGPNGSGTILAAGTSITTNQTVYLYVEINGNFCMDQAFDLTILPLPPIDNLDNVIICNSYTLPVLNNGNYYTQTNGGGTQLQAGDVITTSQDIYIFNDNGTCTNQDMIRISIIHPGSFTDQDVCGEYILPPVEVGGYYTLPSGGGQQIPEGTAITTTQTIYYYVQTTSPPNCTENLSFEVIVTPIPEVDSLEDVLLCNENYALPTLTNGQYFTQPDRGGNELFPGDSISQSQTIYINNLVDGCDNETSFSVEIRPLPEVETFTDIYSCGPFELPELTHGTFYTETQTGGTELHAGDLVTSTQTLYIFNSYDDFGSCYNETSFTVYVNPIPNIQFPYEHISACDVYILPTLNVGNYFTEPNGGGTALFAGDSITTNQEIYIYAETGERFVCTDQTSFTVELFETPVLENHTNIERCGSFTLPDLQNTLASYYREPYGTNEISPEEYTFSEPGTYTIYVYAANENNPDCFDQDSFELTIYPLLELHIEGGTICKNAQTGEVESSVVMTSGLDPQEFTVEWYLDGSLVHTGPDYEALEGGIYTIKTIKLTPEIGPDCNYAPTTVEVFESATPEIEVNVTEPFSEEALITVEIINGFGEYEYQLDDGPFQSDNEFQNVESGAHTVTVQGVNGNCGSTTVEVEVIMYPKFFTPNGDGIHETWNITDLWKHPEAVITIYDRYGKFLAAFPPKSEGWDGNYNGRPLPSSDYWFKVEFEQDGEKKVFRSHFTLKR